MNNDERGAAPFRFTYAAPTAEERREIEAIRSEYLPAAMESGKIEALMRLHRKVVWVPKLASILLGTIGLLLFGLGLTMLLEWQQFALGAAAAVLGAAPMGLAYFVHRALLRRYKGKYGPKILQLSEELLNESEERAQP